jgi:hypothetical protein
MAAAGAGGAPGAIPTGMGFAIMPAADGWVAGATNSVGIQGSFHPFGDASSTPPGDTTVVLGDFDTPTSVCLSGVASQVLGTPPAYSQYYGGGLGLNLADAGGAAGVGPWTRGTVTGFSFTVTGPTIPATLRFNATIPGMATTYCGNIAAGANRVAFSSLNAECYNTPPGAVLPTTTALESIQWQVVTVTTASTPFDFCIENLTAITTP